jgi:carbon-monoxide dehydrogenase medium subunit
LIPAQFAYTAPDELTEAIRLLANSDGEARVLAGGHSLLPVMKLRFVRPSLLVDLRRLRAQLAYVRHEGDTIAIGSLTTHAEIERSALLARLLPVMPAAAGRIGDRLVRSCGTIGGSLCHVDPAGDWPALALALEARATAIGPGGERELPIEELFTGPYSNSLDAGEILTEVRIPLVPDTGAAYVKHGRLDDTDFAVVGCCAAIHRRGRDGVRVAFTGLAAVPHRDRAVEAALSGHALSPDRVDAAAAVAGMEIEPLDDLFGSADYRRHLAHVLARRALTAAAAVPSAES